MNLRFLRFDPTPGEKHLGVATIRLEESIRLIFRFKIIAKDGGGYYCQPASLKVGSSNGKDNYYPSFTFDSSYESDQVKEFVLSHVEPILSQQNQRVFSPAPQQARPNPNYGAYPQQQQSPVQQNQYRQDRQQQQQSYGNAQDEQLPF